MWEQTRPVSTGPHLDLGASMYYHTNFHLKQVRDGSDPVETFKSVKVINKTKKKKETTSTQTDRLAIHWP